MLSDEDWIARVRRLEAEVSGLRRALRSRGLIEQAKGILAERLKTDPENAFTQLSRRSQQRNVSVIELAAGLVGAASGLEAQPMRAAAAAQSAASLPELVAILMGEGLAEMGVLTVALLRTESSQIVACAGAEPIVTRSGAEPGACAGPEPAVVRSAAEPVVACAGVEFAGDRYPVRAANADLLLVIGWADPARRVPLDALAGAIRDVVARLRVPPDLPWDQDRWLRAVFNASFGHAELLSPVRDHTGAIIDFVVDVATEGSAEHSAGARLLDLEPHLAELGVFAAYTLAMEQSIPFDRPAAYETVPYRGRSRRMLLRRRAIRLGDRLLVAKQHLTRAQRQEEQVAQMELIGGLGFGEWDLATGEIHWSAGLHVLFGRDPADGPSALDRLPNLVHPGDAEMIREMVETLTRQRHPVDVEFRVGERVLRMVADAKTTQLIQAVARDVTGERGATEVLRRTEAQLGEQRVRGAAERELTRQMRQVWYPAKALDLGVSGIRVRGRHWVPPEDLRFQADFLDATLAADGDLLLAIGDIVGSGLRAAATMTRLMYPARVMGHAGSPPAEILAALNLELHRDDGSDLAGVVLARYLPHESTLIWAQAGHLAPVLLRGGTARQLTAPEGVLLGLSAPGGFGQAAQQLEPGDLVIFFTDGVLRRDLADPLPPLLRELEKLAGSGGAAAVLDRVIERADGEACLLIAEFCIV